MARSTYFDLGRSADACPGSESGYAQRFQCGNIVKRRIWTRMFANRQETSRQWRIVSCRKAGGNRAIRLETQEWIGLRETARTDIPEQDASGQSVRNLKFLKLGPRLRILPFAIAPILASAYRP